MIQILHKVIKGTHLWPWKKWFTISAEPDEQFCTSTSMERKPHYCPESPVYLIYFGAPTIRSCVYQDVGKSFYYFDPICYIVMLELTCHPPGSYLTVQKFSNHICISHCERWLERWWTHKTLEFAVYTYSVFYFVIWCIKSVENSHKHPFLLLN